jgi:hypothetical protein
MIHDRPHHPTQRRVTYPACATPLAICSPGLTPPNQVESFCSSWVGYTWGIACST